MKYNDPWHENAPLRMRAEEIIYHTINTQDEIISMPKLEVQKLVYELQVHQVELEIQNDELRKTQRALENERERYSFLYNNAPVGYMTLLEDSTIDEANETLVNFLNREKDSVINKPFTDFICCEDQDIFYLQKKAIVETLESQTSEIRIRVDDNTLIWCQLEARLSHNGYEPCLLITVTDISKRKELEKSMLQMKKMDAIGHLASGIAHDFNNILAGMLSFTEYALAEVEEKSELRESLENIEKGIDRATHLVKQILTFGRESTTELIPLSIPTIIIEVSHLLRAALPSTIDITYDDQDKNSYVLADGSQIDEVLLNLCINAAHAMNNKGTIEISCFSKEFHSDVEGYIGISKPGRYSLFSVKDSGEGIRNGQLSQIFDPFFTTKEIGKGTGLGLSVVWGIISNHNGNILIDTAPEVGTTFTIMIPEIEAVATTSSECLCYTHTGSGNIFIVDDEVMLTKSLKRILARCGYGVTTYSDSVLALEDFIKNPYRYDIVITDKTMPIMSGFELSREIRKVNANIPIIICTGYSEKEDLDKIEEIGITTLFQKPYKHRELADKLQEILRSE